MERNFFLKTLGSQSAMEVVLVWKALLAQKLFRTFFRAVYFLDYLNNVEVSSDVVEVGWRGS